MMPTKPLQVAFWSLLMGFVSILALSLLRIDTKPMSLIAGKKASGSAEHSLAAAQSRIPSQQRQRSDRQPAAPRFDDSPPPPASQNTISVSMPGAASHSVTMANTSHRNGNSRRDEHLSRDPVPAANAPDREPDAQNKGDAESLIEIGTIVIPSLASHGKSVSPRDAEQQAQPFTARDRQIIDWEQRLNHLQEKLDRLLASQAEHQTAELESLAQLVEQMQKDREILRLRQKFDDLQLEQRALSSDAKATQPVHSNKSAGRTSARTAQKVTSPATPETGEADTSLETPVRQFDGESESPQPKKEGWTAVDPPPGVDEKTKRRQPTTNQKALKATREAADAAHDSRNGSHAPQALRKASPVVIPEIPSEEEPVISVPAPDDLDSAPFDVEVVPYRVNTDDLPDFKLPPESRSSTKSRQPRAARESSESSRQPTIELRAPADNESQIDTNRSHSRQNAEDPDYTIPPEIKYADPANPAQSETSGSRTIIVPQSPARTTELNVAPATDISTRRDDSPPQRLPRERLAGQTRSTVAAKGPASVDVVVLNVRLPREQNAGIDWDRLRTDDGRPLVDFAPSAERNANEAGLAIGALQGDLHTFQTRLRAIAEVETVSRQQLMLVDRQAEFIDLSRVMFAAEANSSAVENPPAADAVARPGLQLRIQSDAAAEDRIRLLLSLIDPANQSASTLSGDAIVAGGESLVLGGMIFEEIIETEGEPAEPRFKKMPFLGRKKSAKRQMRVQTEQIILLAVKSDSSIPTPAPHQQSGEMEKLADREFELAAEFYEQRLFGPADRHIQLALELSPDNPRARKLADRIAAQRESRR
ncbi:MAG: hypothetical protein WD065_03360 [Planctomycetaceae bacterium]